MNNIHKTWILLTLFFVFVIGVGWIFSVIFQSQAILFIAVIFSIVMAFASYWFSDKIVLAMSKAKPLTRESNPEIYQIVENLCRKANLPLPRIFLIKERQPNAFATGRSHKKAVVAVTQGLLDVLNKEEIEGVLGHELSHIKNRDMLVSTMAVVLVGFVAILSRMFLWQSIFGGRRGGQAGAVLMIIGVAAAILAPLAAMLIQLAISRKREFLADSSGASLTKKPDNLASALLKISKDRTPMKAAQAATAHLYFENPLKGKNVSKFFRSHPPAEERIKALKKIR